MHKKRWSTLCPDRFCYVCIYLLILGVNYLFYDLSNFFCLCNFGFQRFLTFNILLSKFFSLVTNYAVTLWSNFVFYLVWRLPHELDVWGFKNLLVNLVNLWSRKIFSVIWLILRITRSWNDDNLFELCKLGLSKFCKWLIVIQAFVFILINMLCSCLILCDMLYLGFTLQVAIIKLCGRAKTQRRPPNLLFLYFNESNSGLLMLLNLNRFLVRQIFHWWR